VKLAAPASKDSTPVERLKIGGLPVLSVHERIVALLQGNDGNELAVAPPHDLVIRAGDRLTLIGRDKDLAEFQSGAE